jgi:hypothetical protein
MSLTCQKVLKSPALIQSPTMLRPFDGRGFFPHGLLHSLSFQLEGKTVYVAVEVIDTPFGYNFLLGRSWFYAMNVITSSVFQCVQFPHQGKIVTINQLDYFTPNARTPTTNNIPFLGDSKITYESVGVGILKYTSLMGTLLAPGPPTTKHIAMINMILTMAYKSFKSSDPWVVPSPLEFNALGDAMPLSPTEASYDVIQSTSPYLDNQHLFPSNTYSLPSWLNSLSSTFDYILQIFPSDESIMEMITIDEVPVDGS